ncbi:MAG: hypothetical protein HY686_08490 [Chloroflexi bacterium]|nr:hypothetical protein [Chloroflexota bacterium]
MSPIVLVLPLSVLFSTLGLSFVLRSFIENLVSGFLLRRMGNLRPGRRVKLLLLSVPPLKGDVGAIGPFHTTLMEVGDGEHLPSIRTGRMVKIPNSAILNNPIVLYGDTIVDEVIAEVRLPVPSMDRVIADMKEAVAEAGHTPVEVGLYQRDEHLVVHGVFEVRTGVAANERGRILRAFLDRQASVQEHAVSVPE